MAKVKTLGVIRVPAGISLGLSPAQIAARRHALLVLNEKKGIVTTTANVEFKAGEIVDLAVVPKAWDSLVEILGKQGASGASASE